MSKNQSVLLIRAILSASLAFVLAGCQSHKSQTASVAPPSISVAQPVIPTTQAPEAAPVASVPPVSQVIVRIKAGASSAFTDAGGNVWAADQGFNGGDTIERPDITITNTADPGIYRSEHFGMDSFSCPLANGKYLVKLHFAETFEGIEGPGQRVFSFSVQGHEFKDFDVWAKAGGPFKALVESIPVEIMDGKLLITFTSNVENPQINGIEIIPQS